MFPQKIGFDISWYMYNDHLHDVSKYFFFWKKYDQFSSAEFAPRLVKFNYFGTYLEEFSS